MTLEKLIEKYHIGIHDRDEFRNDVNEYTRHIAEQAVKYEKKTWLGDNSGLINRTSENILTRINELTQGDRYEI